MYESTRSWVSAGLIFGMALAASVVIWSVPALFGPHGSSQRWLTGLAGAVALILWAATVFVKPPRRGPAEPNGDRG